MIFSILIFFFWVQTEKSIGERERAKHSKAMETLNSYGMEIGKVNKASFNVGS